jgi:hypothetical protein
LEAKVLSDAKGGIIEVTIASDIHAILDPGVDRIENGKHPDIGDAMNLLGRVVDAVEHLATKLDELQIAARP